MLLTWEMRHIVRKRAEAARPTAWLSCECQAAALFHDVQRYGLLPFGVVVYLNVAWNEILLCTGVCVDHLLRVAVEEREPRTLYLYLYAVSGHERMGNVGQR